MHTKEAAQRVVKKKSSKRWRVRAWSFGGGGVVVVVVVVGLVVVMMVAVVEKDEEEDQTWRRTWTVVERAVMAGRARPGREGVG